MSDDHLSTEEISALLDRGAGEASDGGHVEECPTCRREMELLRRMRMALSALDDREAPPGAWASLETELEQRGVVDGEPGSAGAGEPSPPLRSVGWARAAAAAILFVGGLGLGTHLASPGGADAGETAAAATAARSPESEGSTPAADAEPGAGAAAADPAVAPAPDRPDEGSRLAAAGEGSGRAAGSSEGLTYREARERLEELRAQGPTFREAYRNPEAAAEHLARLEALMRASQEALREDPADPALNDFLFRVAEERESLNRALQLSSLEYR